MTVKYSRHEKSFIVTGFNNGPEVEPQILAEHMDEIMRDLQRIRNIQVLIPDEYIVAKEKYPNLVKRALQHKGKEKERTLTDEIFRVQRKSQHAANARKAQLERDTSFKPSTPIAHTKISLALGKRTRSQMGQASEIPTVKKQSI